MFVFLSLVQVCWQGTFAALAYIDKALAPTKRAQTAAGEIAQAAMNLIAHTQTQSLAPLPAPMLQLKV
jgi:hypothetical protein